MTHYLKISESYSLDFYQNVYTQLHITIRGFDAYYN